MDVTYENTGTGTWDGSDPLWVRLRTQNSPTGLWGTFNINLGCSDYIEPGQTKTFTFNITAPATDGPYNCRWQLQKQWPGSTSLFGELLDVPVQVGAAAEICDDGIDNDGDSDIDCEDSDCDGADSVMTEMPAQPARYVLVLSVEVDLQLTVTTLMSVPMIPVTR